MRVGWHQEPRYANEHHQRNIVARFYSKHDPLFLRRQRKRNEIKELGPWSAFIFSAGSGHLLPRRIFTAAAAVIQNINSSFDDRVNNDARLVICKWVWRRHSSTFHLIANSGRIVCPPCQFCAIDYSFHICRRIVRCQLFNPLLQSSFVTFILSSSFVFWRTRISIRRQPTTDVLSPTVPLPKIQLLNYRKNSIIEKFNY